MAGKTSSSVRSRKLSLRPVRLDPVDLLRAGFRGIMARKARAALSITGISIGVATLILVTSLPSSSHAALMRDLSDLGTNLLRAEAEPDHDPPVQLPETAAAMAARVGPVTRTSAVANTHALVRRSDRTDPDDGSGINVLASTDNLLTTVNGNVQSGRFIDSSSDSMPVAVLGHIAAGRLGFNRLVPGQQPPLVMINNSWFTVIGILDPMPLASDIERAVLVGWESARNELGFSGHPTVIYANAREDSMEDVRAILPATLYPQLPGLVRVSRPSDALAAKMATKSSFSVLLIGLSAVALLVGGLGVANTMYVSVLERRREIGLRRALGATRGHIKSQFIAESITLSTVGGMIGMALGVIISFAYSVQQGWPPVISVEFSVVGTSGTVLIGIVAGLIPAIQAARISPTVALSS